MFSIKTGYAHGYYAAAGYDFLPGSAEATLGYRKSYWALEVMVLNRGKEERITRPGPQVGWEVLAYMPVFPVFVKGGVSIGAAKNGYNFGAGVDIPLQGHWATRGQILHYRVTEDAGQAAEEEDLISLALKYSF